MMCENNKKQNFIYSPKYLSLRDLIFIFISFFLSYLLSGLIVKTIEYTEFGTNLICNGLLSVVSYVAASAIMLFIVLIYRELRASGDGCAKIRSLLRVRISPPSQLLYGIVMMFAAQLISHPIGWLFPDSFEQYVKAIEGIGEYAVVISVLLAPIFEEILFRGVVLQDISRAHGAMKAVVISSLFFAVIHLNLLQFLPAFLSALVLGYVYVSRGSIRAVIFIHFVNNAIAYSLLEFFPIYSPQMSLEWCKANIWAAVAVYGVSLLLFGVMIYQLTVRCREFDEKELVECKKKESEDEGQ